MGRFNAFEVRAVPGLAPRMVLVSGTMALVLLGAACSSTARSPRSQGAPSTETGGRATAGSSSGTGTGAGGEMRTGSDSAAAQRANRTGPTALRGGPSTTAGGRGVGGSVSIGVQLVDDDASTVVRSVSGANVVFGDTRAFAKALVGWVNKQGGMGGRRVVPVYYTVNTAQVVVDDSPEAQAACATWTEDNRVSAVLMPIIGGDNWVACMAAHNLPFFDGDTNFQPDADGLTRYGTLYFNTYGLQLERLVRAYVDGLTSQRFLTSQSRIGLLYLETPTVRRAIRTTLKPLLESRGLHLVDEAGFKPPTGIGDNWSQFALRFRTNKVDRVLHLGGAGWPFLQFSQAAESQNYYPDYGMNSTSAIIVMQDAMPPAQLDGARGVGWIPSADVDWSRDPGPVSANQKLCVNIMRQAGEELPSRTELAWALAYCDAFFFFKAALDAGGSLTPSAFASAAESLGSTYRSAITFATRFGPGRHDGVAKVRNLTFDNGCRCFRYLGTAYAPP